MESVKRQDVPDCVVCGAKGALLYKGLTDVRFGIPGSFDMKRCVGCGLLWLDPGVAREDIHKYYETFFPHYPLVQPKDRSRDHFLGRFKAKLKEMILCGYYGYDASCKQDIFYFLGRILGHFRYFRMKATEGLEDIFLSYKEDMSGHLLMDVGCGEGTYLEKMKTWGWPVFGIEPHEDACRVLAQKNIPFIKGTLDDVQSLPDAMADQVTLIHVLEHVYDPLAAVLACYRLLKKGGRLIVHVPNAQSLAHKFFKRNCYHLDPPRHVFGFSVRSLELLFGKSPFETVSLMTVSFHAESTYDSSQEILKKGARSVNGVKRQRGRFLFFLIESFLIICGYPAGEEIRVVAVK